MLGMATCSQPLPEAPGLLQEAMRLAHAHMPAPAASNLAEAAFGYVGDALVHVLQDDALPAFNVYAIFRLNDDVCALLQLAETLPYPNLRVSPPAAQLPCPCVCLGQPVLGTGAAACCWAPTAALVEHVGWPCPDECAPAGLSWSLPAAAERS